MCVRALSRPHSNNVPLVDGALISCRIVSNVVDFMPLNYVVHATVSSVFV